MANRAAQFRAQYAAYPVKRRGRNFIEFDTGATTTWIGSIEPLHHGTARDAEIDDGWHVSSGAWQWEMVANDFQLHARDVLNAGALVEWRDVDTQQTVTVQPLALNWVDSVTNSRQQIALPQAVTAQASDNVLFWQNGYGAGRHFRYISHPKRLIKQLIIDSAAALPTPTVQNPWLEIEFIVAKSAGCTYWVDGAQWDNSTQTMTANRIEVRDTTQNVLWYFDAPIATDAAGNTVAGVFQLRRQGQNRYCTVRVPKSWVDSAIFPIALDPTFTDGPSGTVDTAFDAQLDAENPTTNTGTATVANIGYLSLASRMILKFDVSSLSGATISSSTLSLTPNSVDGPGTLDAYNIASGNASMTEAGACWSYRTGTTAWAGSAGCSTSGTDYNASKLFDSIGSWVGTTTKAVTLTTARVTDWLTGNYGLIIRSQNEADWNNVQMSSSDHATSGYRPLLTVVYTSGATVSVAGTLATSGSVGKSTSKFLAGTLASAGALIKSHSFSLAGTLASAGVLTKVPARVLAGTLATSGTIARSLSKALAGTLATAGGLVRSLSLLLSGTLASSGTISVSTGGAPVLAAVQHTSHIDLSW